MLLLWYKILVNMYIMLVYATAWGPVFVLPNPSTHMMKSEE
jgi:hypothetical protein